MKAKETEIKLSEQSIEIQSSPIIKDPKEKQSQTELAIACIAESITCFHDEIGTAFAGVHRSDHIETLHIESDTFRKTIDHEYYKKYGKMLRKETISEVERFFVAKAIFDGEKHEMELRIAKGIKDEIWYDLGASDWQCIHISKEGWKMVPHSKPLFRRSAVSAEQTVPKNGGDPWRIFRFLNVPDTSELLTLVYIISLFIPDIPHPILLIHGSRGASKSTFARIVKSLVDPGSPELLSLPSSNEELVRILNRSYYIGFDNLSQITNDCSDTLCRAVTGEGYVKRKLYSDNEDVIFRFRRSICLNGINAVANRPDLLDRSIPIELERISEEKRKTEQYFWESFKMEKAGILGGIFDVLTRTLGTYPVEMPKKLPRMADFAEWGYRIAESLGGRGNEFLESYSHNEQERNRFVLEDDLVAHMIISLFERHHGGSRKWEGTPTELYRKLQGIAKMEEQERYFPKSASSLARKLNEVKVNLRDEGISILEFRTHSGRKILIEKIDSASENQTGTEDKDNLEDFPF